MKEKKQLVSIITPSYNQGRFIEETINSVLGQDYPNIEYIVVDGASTDETLSVLKRYENRLKWISEKDRGQSDAINKGFAMATGDVLAWLASDDTYFPGAISKAVEALQSDNKIGLVYGKGRYIDEAGRPLGEYPTEVFDYERLAVSNYICQPSAFFTKEALKTCGGVDTGLTFAMDYDLWMRMAKRVGFEYVEEYFSNFRLHKESKTVSAKNAPRREKEALEAVMKYYGRAPLNRVYGYCRGEAEMKGRFVGWRTFFMTIKEYIRLNRGIKMEDMRLLQPKLLAKLFKDKGALPR